MSMYGGRPELSIFSERVRVAAWDYLGRLYNQQFLDDYDDELYHIVEQVHMTAVKIFRDNDRDISRMAQEYQDETGRRALL